MYDDALEISNSHKIGQGKAEKSAQALFLHNLNTRICKDYVNCCILGRKKRVLIKNY